MQHHQNNEIALWEAFVQGDKDAYSTLYRMYHPRLYNYGHKFTANTGLVEDCIQELLIYLWMHRSKLNGVQHFRSYLFVAYRHRLLKGLQADNRMQTNADAGDYSFDFEASIDQVMINKEHLYEQRIHLNKAVDQLTSRQREAVFFMYYENLSYAEIAQVLNISRKACYKLVARAIADLRAAYIREKVFFILLAFSSFL